MSTKTVISTLLLVASTAACYEWRTETLAPEVATTTLAARMARVTLVNGRAFEVVDPRIARDTLLARSVTYYDPSRSKPLVVPVSQIRRMETRHFSPGPTAVLAVGLASIAVAAYIIVTNLSFDLGCFPACN